MLGMTGPFPAHQCKVQVLLTGVCGSAAEITMFDNVIVVYKTLGDLMFYVTGSHEENELILYTVLQGFYESVSLLLRYAQLAPVITSCCNFRATQN